MPINSRSNFAPNMSKWLLWEDPLTSFLSPQYAEEPLEQHYKAIADHLQTKLNHPLLNSRLELPQRLARVLSLKCHLRKHLVAAYKKHDYDALSELAHGRLTVLRNQVDALWQYHRRMWMSTYKPFGWEVVEARYGTLRARLQTMFETIIAHVGYMREHRTEEEDDDQDERSRIPEFEVDLECLYLGVKTNLLLDHARVISTSRPG
jgi:hypothetical protein